MRRRRIIKNSEQKNTVIMTLDEILEIPNLVANINHTHHLCSRNYIHYQEENITEDQIYLITQFFIHRDKQRNIELRHCLKKNCKVMDTIILLNERIYSQEELGLNDEEIKKIEQIVIGKRLGYKIFLDFIRNSDLTGYFILSNTDIFFNETVTNLRKSFLHLEKSMYAISRREIDSLGEITEKHINSDSQDTWILHSNNLIEDTTQFDFNLGVLGCDNRVTMLFHLLEFKIYNCPNFINTFHFHEDDKRDYSRDVVIPSPYLYPIPLLKHKKISLIKMNEENLKYITEDFITDWVKIKNGILFTRKHNTLKLRNFTSRYVCLTGNQKSIILFQRKILPKIKHSIILILIEADIIKIPKDILNNPFVSKIFQWNKEINHDKISCIPIGLNNDRQLAVLLKSNKNIQKEKLCLINFSVDSHPVRRKISENSELMKISTRMNYLPPEKTYHIRTYSDGKLPIDITNSNYYNELGKYKFVLSPRGGGEDCHRTWEALYMGCIPIVLSSSINEIYDELPVLVVNCWSEITEELLHSKWEEYQKREWNMEKLKMTYWLEKFEQIKENFTQENKKHIIITTTNENKTYCGFVPSVYQMWKKNYPNCHFVLGVISNKDREDDYIKRLEEFSDDFYLFKNEEDVDSGVQAKVSRLYLSTLYDQEVVTIVDVDQYIFDFEWMKIKLEPAFDRKFVSLAYEAYIRTPDRGKWPMPYTSAPSDIFKKIVNYNNIDNYKDWLNSLKKISKPIDNKECIRNKFDKYSDESTLRYLVETHPERKSIYDIWVKVKREDATVYNEAKKRLDRWNWDRQFNTAKLKNGYFLDCWPVRPFEKNFDKLKPLLEHMNLDLSKDKIFLNGE